MILRTSLIFAAACTLSQAFVRSGHATVDWWTSSLSYKPGEPVATAIRMELDSGWHTYWSNPGEGGMKLSVEWTMPPGWTASEPAHPVPMRFMTGGLAGFGYEGEVLYPVTLTPPADASGPVTVTGKLSWLTCDDSACVPGDAVLTMTLNPGKPVETANSRAIAAAQALVPQLLAAAELGVAEADGMLTLTLKLPDGTPDLAQSQIFPETLRAVDPAAEIKFTKDGVSWTATVPRNEYASEPLKELALVVAPKDGAAVRVVWNAAVE